MASSNINLNALGLNYSPNALSLPPGSLTQADNVIIRRDNTIESRRGFRDYSQSLSGVTQQLIEYKNRLIAHTGTNGLEYDTQVLDADTRSIFAAFAGTYLPTETGLRIKSIEANGNLYFTTADGIKKLSSLDGTDFTSDTIRNSGAIKALDITADLDITQGQLDGYLPNDSAVAYRVVYGYKDNNQNLLLGTPSNRVVVYNYLTDVTAMDLNALAETVDVLAQSASYPHIDDGNYAQLLYTPLNSDTSLLQTNIVEFALKLDTDIHLATISGASASMAIGSISVSSNICTVTFSSGDPRNFISNGDHIILSNFTGSASVINTDVRITAGSLAYVTIDAAPTATTIQFAVTTANFTQTSFSSVGDIYSYNYQYITSTGDTVEAAPLITLTLSTPATHEQTNTCYNTLSRILTRLKAELSGVIPTALQTQYFVPFFLTENANVKVTMTLPTDLLTDYFVQVYRTRIFTATAIQTLGDNGGTPVIPDDEMRLVFEDFPTSAEIAAGSKVFIDNTPDELVLNNTNLYTNPESGEGILNANEPPPFAKDINSFKGYTFYANTKTKQKIPTFQLLGVSNIDSGDTITIGNATSSDTYTFQSGAKEVTDITCTSASAITNGHYFEIHSANDGNFYTVYAVKDNVNSPPSVTGATNIPFYIFTGDSPSQVAQAVMDALNVYIYGFTVIANTLPKIRVTNIDEGVTTVAVDINSGFTVTRITAGNGEDATTKKVLLSSLTSAAQAIEQTAQSLVRIINKQSDSVITAYYISSDITPPGQMDLEARNVSDSAFYIIASTTDTGNSFNPSIEPEFPLSASGSINQYTLASPTVIRTSAAHGLQSGQQIMITGSVSGSSTNIDGVWTVTVTDSTHFTIPKAVTTAGTQGAWSLLSLAAPSTDDINPNRIFYSKYSQPEAVPLLNYFDISAKDKEIVRIMPLRDTLFVFKKDGTYRVSGQVAPFTTSLLDTSTIVVAADSVSVANNIIYSWTTKGITPITETGAGREVSRPIDTQILYLSSSQFTNFSTATWGIGYDSDSSYLLFTNSATDDTVATIVFRYCILTNTWTNFTITQNCGIISPSKDRIFTASGTSAIIQEERKEFLRTDFADNEFGVSLGNGDLFTNGSVLRFPSVLGMAIGDVITQDQTVTVYKYNNLLNQLDADPTVGLNTISSTTGGGTTLTVNLSAAHGLTTNDYVTISETNSVPVIDGTYKVTVTSGSAYTITIPAVVTTQATTGHSKRSYIDTIPAVAGSNMRTSLVNLCTYLDNDPGLVLTTYSSKIGDKTGTISLNTPANPTILTASGITNLVDGRIVTLTGTNGSIPTIGNATYEISNTGTWGTSSSFSIDVDVTTGGTTGITYATTENLNNFDDIEACFNAIINQLNVDTGATYTSYPIITKTTLFEAIITNINPNTRKVTVNLPLEWVYGDMTVFKSIDCEFTFAPITNGDPLMSKHISDATFMFNNKAFTNLTASFSSDLMPAFVPVSFTGDGVGLFGSNSGTGFGYGQFGGNSTSGPFRTFVPRNAQRCRFLNIKLNHQIARESWSLFGITLTGEMQISTRAYR